MIGRACATRSRLRKILRLATLKESLAEHNLKHLPTSLQCRYFELKMGPWEKGSIAEKNEKFCWTREQVLCDNGKSRKTCTESNRSSNSCFNYENTTHYLSLFSRVGVGFARASSASGTSAAGNRWYESGCSGADESGSRSAAAACHEPRAGTAPPATNLAPGQQPPPPGEPGAVGQPPAVGQPGAPGAVTSPAAAGATSPAAAAAASAAPAVAATPEQPAGFLGGNWLIDKFHKGGPIMWPILIVSIVALTVVLERIHLVGWPLVPTGSETDRESFHRN